MNVLQLANALAEQVTASDLTPAITGEKKFLTRIDIESLKSDTKYRLTIIPKALQAKRVSRSSFTANRTLDCIFHRIVQTEEETDAALNHLEDFVDWLSAQTFGGHTVDKIDCKTLWDSDSLNTAQLFAALITVTL